MRVNKDAEVMYWLEDDQDGQLRSIDADYWYHKHRLKLIPNGYESAGYTALLFPKEFDERGAVTKMYIGGFR